MEKQNVPTLRFSEFEGVWSMVKLGKKTTKVGSGVTPRGGSKVYTDSGVLFIRSQNVNNNRLLLDDVAFIPNDIHSSMSSSTVYPNDVLLNITGASIGRSCIVPSDLDEANVNQHVCIIRLKDSEIPKFYQTLLASHKGQKLIFQGQAGGGREGLNFASIRAFKLRVPQKPEQQKIASFLSAVDKKIEQLTRKKELLERYKKGVMQKLFPPPSTSSGSGEVQHPELRFKQEDGSDFPDWEVKRLGEIGNFYGGGTPSSNVDSYWDGNTAWISSSDVYEDNITDLSQSRWITEKAISDSATKVIPKGAILIVSRVGLGKFVVAPNELCTSQDFTNIVTKLDPYFFAYYFLSTSNRFLRLAQGTSIKGVSSSDIKKMNYLIPSSLEEQNLISEFLMKLEKNISKINSRIEKAQIFKKGLLQQMFV